MTMTLEEVRRRIDKDEPDYSALATELGTAALVHLRALAADSEPMLASKATYLAGVIGGEGAVQVLEKAGQRPEPEVRVAAAASVGHLDVALVERVAGRMLDDKDAGVRKATLKSVAGMRSRVLEERMRALQGTDPEQFVRQEAQRSLSR